MNKRAIPIFFNTDNNYAVPTYIALFSLLYNYHGSLEINAYILAPDNFSDNNSILLISLSDIFKCVRIRIIRIKDGFDSVLIKQEHISQASMYRLLIPRIVDSIPDTEMNVCIYLDSDLVVEGDISELFNNDINGYYIGGVTDLAQSADRTKSLSLPSMDRYINSGVLLINLIEINNKEGLKEQLEEAGYRDDFYYKDQDAINSVLYEGIKVLPLKYNVFAIDIYKNANSFYKQYGAENIKEARKNPVIIHYLSDKKPWLYKTTIMSDRWWKYVKIQNSATLNEHIIPFLKSQKAPLSKRIKETVKTVLKRLNLYYLIKGEI